MLTLTRARAQRIHAGEPLPTVFDKLAANTVHVRRSQLTLIAAAPGVGKSLISLAVALRAGVPGFYFSADTDSATMYNRAAAMHAGWSVEDVENAVARGFNQTIDAQLNALHHVRFHFESQLTTEEIEQELEAYALVYGEWPQLIVVDNLRNVCPDGDEDMDEMCDYLHALARETDAAVLTLHHVKGQYNDGRVPIPLSGLIGQIGKVPETILTLHKGGLPGAETLNVSPVKNRTGRAEPSGAWYIPLAVQYERMSLT